MPRLPDRQHNQRTGRERDGTVRMPATAASGDHRQPPLQPGQRSPIAGAEIGHIRGNRGQPEHAGPALPGTGMRLKTKDLHCLGEDAATGRQHNDRADAPGQACRSECRCAVGNVGELLQIDPAAGNAPDQCPTGRQGPAQASTSRSGPRSAPRRHPAGGPRRRSSPGRCRVRRLCRRRRTISVRTGRAVQGAQVSRRCPPVWGGRHAGFPDRDQLPGRPGVT